MKILPHDNDPRAPCAPGGPSSVSVLGGVVFWRHDQPTALAGPPVHCLDDVDHLLLVLHGPVDLVVVAGAQVDHDVLVPVRGKGSVLTRIPLKKNRMETSLTSPPPLQVLVKHQHNQEDPPWFRRLETI